MLAPMLMLTKQIRSFAVTTLPLNTLKLNKNNKWTNVKCKQNSPLSSVKFLRKCPSGQVPQSILELYGAKTPLKKIHGLTPA